MWKDQCFKWPDQTFLVVYYTLRKNSKLKLLKLHDVIQIQVLGLCHKYTSSNKQSGMEFLYCHVFEFHKSQLLNNEGVRG